MQARADRATAREHCRPDSLVADPDPRTEAAFLRALEKGQQVADTDRAAVEQAMEAFLDVPPPVAAVMALPQYLLGGADRARMQRIVDVIQRFGMLKARFNVSQLIG
jgi:NitT/TauT family transport system substrate-binding protein